MRAIGYTHPGPIDRPDALVDLDLPRPVPTGRDLLVEVQAISVNPVDTKVRSAANPFDGRAERILGWDAAGVVAAVGPDVTRFKIGDAVFYAGNIARDGSNAEFQLVDERIVGRKPATLGAAEAAALPLTAITAWETLFDRLRVQDGKGRDPATLLIIGGAGGVGSIAIQIARAQTGLTIVATASRPETQAWVHDLGAHHVIDHSRPMAPQIAELGLDAPRRVAKSFSRAGAMRDLVADTVVHLVARLVPRQGKAADLSAAIESMLAEVRAEPGCIAYDAHASRDAPGVIVMIEAWEDQAALDAHAAAPAFKRLAARFDELLAEPVSLERLTRIA